MPHAAYDHAGDLVRDDIVRHAVPDPLARPAVAPARQEAQHLPVHAVQVRPVLVRVLQAALGDLRELAAAGPAAGHEGVDFAGDALAVHPGGGGGAREGLAVGVQPLAVAVPLVGLHGEGVGGVRGALVMAMDLKGEE